MVSCISSTILTLEADNLFSRRDCVPPCPPCWPPRRGVPARSGLLLRAAVRWWKLIGTYGDRKAQQVYCVVCGNNGVAPQLKRHHNRRQNGRLYTWRICAIGYLESLNVFFLLRFWVKRVINFKQVNDITNYASHHRDCFTKMKQVSATLIPILINPWLIV